MTAPGRIIPLLIAVPDGLSLGGVTTWAVDTASALAKIGRPVGIIRHARRRGDIAAEVALHPGVRMFDCSHLPPMDARLGACEIFEEFYGRAVAEFAAGLGGGPVAAVPTQMGDCFGVFASLENKGWPVRILGWRHSLSSYERAVIRHYAPWLRTCVAISDELAADCAAAAPGVPIVRLPHAVEVSDSPRRRRSGPLRLVYVGRLEHAMKRASLLPAISDELHRCGVPHRLAVVGAGELEADLRAAAASNPSLHVEGALSRARTRELLCDSDVLLLPSRTEGLSLSLLEAMACGCVPIVTATLSGVRALVSRETGYLVEFSEDPMTQAQRFARAAEHAAAGDLHLMSQACKRCVRERHDPAQFIGSLVRLLDGLATDGPRTPPARSPWFTSGTAGGSGTVPADAAERMRRLLDSLAGRRVLIHGTGRHTQELLTVIRGFDDRVVGFVDDDPTLQGTSFDGRPVLGPSQAVGADASDVIISSAIHQDAIVGAWRARPHTLRIHALYERSTAS